MKPRAAAKRKRDDDIPNELTSDSDVSAKRYVELSNRYKCSHHEPDGVRHGYCFITPQGGERVHKPIKKEELIFWAKEW